MAKKKIKRNTPTPNVRANAVDMSIRQVQFLIEEHFKWLSLQQSTRAHMQILNKESLENANIRHVFRAVTNMRADMRDFLHTWSENCPAAKYFKDNVSGIGPFHAAGLAAYIDINKCKNHYSSVWNHAGLAPDSRPMLQREAYVLIEEALEKFKVKHGDTPHKDHVKFIAEKLDRDYEPFLRFCKKKSGPVTWQKIKAAMTHPQYEVTLKKICLSIGNDIILKKSIYQDLFRHRYEYEHTKSENGEYAKRAKKALDRFDYDPRKEAYKHYIQGKLPHGHLRSSARNYAVKILLAHYYQIEYYIQHGEAPPDVYALDILHGHRKIHIPGNWKEYIAAVRAKGGK